VSRSHSQGSRSGSRSAAQAAEWVIAAERTKNGCEHRVPVSAPAMEIIAEAEALRAGPWLLPKRSSLFG